MHTIYHIPGVKVGCTTNFDRRKSEYPVGTEFEIIGEFADLSDMEAGDIEWLFADIYGYPRGGHYWSIGSEAAYKRHEEKDENGKSALQVRAAAKLHAPKDEQGRSIVGVKATRTRNSRKDENGKAIALIKTNRKMHAAKDENGKSIVGVKRAAKNFAEKNEQGQSITAVKIGIAAHAEKDELGRSIASLKSWATRRRNKALKALLEQGWHPPLVFDL